MRKSRAETAETRRKIVDTAAREYRRNGIDGTGLADLMARAGLTHGGFYRHFDSKEALVAAALQVAAKDLVEGLARVASNKTPRGALKAIADTYLSTRHRDKPEGGCPLAALGSELARADRKIRRSATVGFEELVRTVADLIKTEKNPEGARDEALVAVMLMIGALTVSRVVDDPDLAAETLSQANKQIQRFAV